jgi:hypothetical protein
MRSLAVVAAAVLVSTAFVAAPGQVAGAADGSQVVSLTATSGPFVADGLTPSAGVSVITAQLREPQCLVPVSPTVDWYVGGALATLERISGGPAQKLYVTLARTGGTCYDGTYSGTWRPGSTHNGTWVVSHVAWIASEGASYEDKPYTDIDPRVSPGVTASVAVVGTRPPKVTQARIPAVVPYGARQWVQYTFRTSTGRPLAGQPIRYDSSCPYQVIAVPAAPSYSLLRTDSLGRVTVRAYQGGGSCVYFWSRATTSPPPGAALLGLYFPDRSQSYTTVTATPSASAVRLGRPIVVKGVVLPRTGPDRVALQRLVGRTWRTLSSLALPTSGPPSTWTGRFTLPTTSTVLGPQYLRVVVSGGYAMAPTPSRILVVTGTRR